LPRSLGSEHSLSIFIFFDFPTAVKLKQQSRTGKVAKKKRGEKRGRTAEAKSRLCFLCTGKKKWKECGG
jgi:hypothetical protein